MAPHVPDETPREADLAIGELRLAELEARARYANGGGPLPLKDWVALAEAWHIASALRASHGNRSAAARALGIGRRTLYAKMEKLSLAPVWAVPARGNGRAHDGDRPAV
jgi:DNA-binding NtrC family response regulator